MTKEALIAYAGSFASFLLDSKVGKHITRIILFGSVARGDFTDQSDVDIFVDTSDSLERDIYALLSLFEGSLQAKAWRLKGVSNKISVKIGQLHEWGLKREVISSGIILYGKYIETPKNTEYYALFSVSGLIKKKSAQQIFRKLYGYTQRVGKKTYQTQGLIESLNGKKLGRGVFIIPMNRRSAVISYLNKQKVRYTLHEIWSDGF